MLRNSEAELANVTVTLTEAELASFYKNELYEARQEAGGCLHQRLL